MTKQILFILVVALCGATTIHAIETGVFADLDKSISALGADQRLNLEELQKIIEQIIEKIKDIVEDVREKITEALGIVEGKLAEIIEETLKKIDEIADKLIAELERIEELGGEAANCVKGKKDQLKEIAAQSREELLDAAEVARNKTQQVVESLKPASEAIHQLLTEIKDTVVKCLEEKTQFQKVLCLLGKVEEIRGKAENLVKQVDELIASAKPQLQDIIGELKQSSKASIEKAKAATDAIVKEVKDCLAQIS